MVKLVASMVVRDELPRYLDLTVASLLEFCDEIRVLDDGSKKETRDWLAERAGVAVKREPRSTMFQHEGQSRNRLLAWTLEADPTHVLAIDADEFVADGDLVRAACSRHWPAGSLWIEEVWEAWPDCLCLRVDRAWRPRAAPVLWEVTSRRAAWRVEDRPLAVRREPTQVRDLERLGRVAPTGTELLHFGWAKEAERAARVERYALADGGRYHAGSHLDSILIDRDRVQLEAREWPDSLLPFREELLTRTGRIAV